VSVADVAIDFSIPSAAVGNLTNCFNAGVPVVSGTTGWLDNYDEMSALCNEKNGSFIYASNFSLGVNLFFELNKKVAQLMNPMLGNYGVTTEEIHHTKKLDAPSGTAITLAEGIIENTDSAYNRQGFALGAVVASEWLSDKKGIYKMKDVLGL